MNRFVGTIEKRPAKAIQMKASRIRAVLMVVLVVVVVVLLAVKVV